MQILQLNKEQNLRTLIYFKGSIALPLILKDKLYQFIE